MWRLVKRRRKQLNTNIKLYVAVIAMIMGSCSRSAVVLERGILDNNFSIFLEGSIKNLDDLKNTLYDSTPGLKVCLECIFFWRYDDYLFWNISGMEDFAKYVSMEEDLLDNLSKLRNKEDFIIKKIRNNSYFQLFVSRASIGERYASATAGLKTRHGLKNIYMVAKKGGGIVGIVYNGHVIGDSSLTDM